MEIKADVIDYMGKYEGSILVLLSLICDGEYTEGTIIYNEENILLTVQHSVEDKLGGPIELWEGYKSLLETILSKLVPAGELIGRLDDVNFSEYLDIDDEIYYIDDQVDQSELIFATQSNSN